MTSYTCPYYQYANDSWSNIVQEFTEKKRSRPVSAPNTRQELQARESDSISNNNRCNKSNRAASARARLVDIANRKDESMPVFQRSAEIQAVVDILQDTRLVCVTIGDAVSDRSCCICLNASYSPADSAQRNPFLDTAAAA